MTMASRAQSKARRAQRQQKKQQQKIRRQREQKRRRQTAAQRLAARVSQQAPVAWPGEQPEDVAVFDDEALSTLSPELSGQAMLIRSALADIAARADFNEGEQLSAIPRRSPFAEWRVFARGFERWIADAADRAWEAWSRLDPERRPYRIALSLMVSVRDDLATLEPNGRVPVGPEGADARLDADLLYHANLVRKSQVNRVGIRAARAICQIPVPPEAEDATVTPDQIGWLRSFTKQFRPSEPELVQALHEVTIHRAFSGPYKDVFAQAARFLSGPAHDPNNSLLKSIYALDLNEFDRARDELDTYLKRDLPNIQHFTAPYRNAIESHVHLMIGGLLAEVPFPTSIFGAFAMMDGSSDVADDVLDHYEAAAAAYPQNREAWRAVEAWYHDQLDIDQRSKAEREELLDRLAAVHRRWVVALPEDVAPRLALVDYLLERDGSDEAKNHVDQLAGLHHTNPLGKAMQWRWNLLEAMRLCRRKAWLANVPARLDEADDVWPKWLAKDWLPYLRAAYELRCGNAQAFQQLTLNRTDTGTVDCDSPRHCAVDACMKLAAAQRMRVPSADLKPLRQMVDDALRQAGEEPLEGLLQLTSFFWDLERMQLGYPAYRSHGRKFLTQLLVRVKNEPERVLGDLDSPLTRSALLALAHNAMFVKGYRLALPSFLADRKFDTHPTIAAAIATAIVKGRSRWEARNFAPLADHLRNGARTADPFYRHFL